MKKIFLLFLSSLILAGCISVTNTTNSSSVSSSDSSSSVISQSSVLNFTVKDVDGNDVNLADYQGKKVYINFWATWCGPCLKEMPELSALDAMREHIVVIGLAYEDNTPEDMRAFMKEHPVVYPIALVDVYDPPKDFETPRGLPMTYIIAPDGTVAKQYTGPVTARMIEQDIAKAGGPAAG